MNNKLFVIKIYDKKIIKINAMFYKYYGLVIYNTIKLDL